MSTLNARVMEGDLVNFSIKDILNVLSISRQLMLLRLEIQSFTADITLKSGHVVSATANNGQHGKDAVVSSFQLALRGKGQFVVYQLPQSKNHIYESIDSIGGLFTKSKLLREVSPQVKEPQGLTEVSTPTRLVDTSQLKKSRNFNKKLDSIELLLAQIDTNSLSERLDILEQSIVKLVTSQNPQDDYTQHLNQLQKMLEDIKTTQNQHQIQLNQIDTKLLTQTGDQNSSMIMDFAKNMVESNKPNKGIMMSLAGVICLQVVGLIFIALTWSKISL